MARGVRLDAEGALHHVLGRGLERRRIFLTASDYRHFKHRLGQEAASEGTKILAWALMPNHYHLLLATGVRPVSELMQRLLTSYVIGFNARHHRVGPLFQGRYKSLLCQREPHLLALVRYIHLNPLRARLVNSLDDLEAYPWCGHGALVGRRAVPWQETKQVLDLFADSTAGARTRYRAFVAEGVSLPAPNLESEGEFISRTAGVWSVRPKGARRWQGEEEQVAGPPRFVESALEQLPGTEDRRSRLRHAGWTPEKVVSKAARMFGLAVDDLYGPGKHPSQVRARALACKWLVDDLGLSGAEAARHLRVSQPAVSLGLVRGRKEAAALGQRLEETDASRRI